MKKKIIITVCMAMTVLTGLAQSPLSFHAKAGIGTSHFHGKHSSSDTQIAYKAGVGAECPQQDLGAAIRIGIRVHRR